MSIINISTILISDIEKEFRDHLPKRAIRLLMLLAEQMQTMEKTVNAQHQLMMLMAKYLIRSAQGDLLVNQLNEFSARVEKDSLTASEDIMKGEEDGQRD